jgi:hypothetical protein
VKVSSHCLSKVFNDDDDHIGDQHQYELPNSKRWKWKLFISVIQCVWQWKLHVFLKETIHTYTSDTQDMGIS